MITQLDQEQSIDLIRKLKILPIEAKITIGDNEKERAVIRNYCIDVTYNGYKMNKLIVEYKLNKTTEKINTYSVSISNEGEDIILLCKYTPSIFNTLIHSLILLELSNWRRVSMGLQPLRTIDDYTILMFEVDKQHNRQYALLERLINKDNTDFLKTFSKFQNTNDVIPIEIWTQALIDFIK